MDLIITILPVVTKDLPISPRFSPCQFFIAHANSAILQHVNQWLVFTYSRSHAFRYGRKNTNPTLVRIELSHDFRPIIAGVVQVAYQTTGATSIFPAPKKMVSPRAPQLTFSAAEWLEVELGNPESSIFAVS